MQQDIRHQKDLVAKALATCRLQPLVHAQSAGAFVQEKEEGMLCRLLLNHFKQNAFEDEVYTINLAHMPGLRDTLHEQESGVHSKRLRGKRRLLDLPIGFMCDEAPVGMPAFDVAIFRLMHAGPKRQRLIETPVSCLRSDHVAVSMCKVLGAAEDNLGAVIGADKYGDPLARVKVFGLDTFMDIRSEQRCKSMHMATFSKEKHIHFRGFILSDLGHSNVAKDIITNLAHADALPHRKVVHVLDDVQAVALVSLQIFVDAGLVRG